METRYKVVKTISLLAYVLTIIGFVLSQVFVGLFLNALIISQTEEVLGLYFFACLVFFGACSLISVCLFLFIIFFKRILIEYKPKLWSSIKITNLIFCGIYLLEIILLIIL